MRIITQTKTPEDAATQDENIKTTDASNVTDKQNKQAKQQMISRVGFHRLSFLSFNALTYVCGCEIIQRRYKAQKAKESKREGKLKMQTASSCTLESLRFGVPLSRLAKG